MSEQEVLLRRVLKNLERNLTDYLTFDDEISANATPGWPSWPQSIRIKAFLKNKRILIADDTGVNGKTFVGVASKISLDRETGYRNPAFVIAPNAGLLNAWAGSEINRYAAHLGAPKQNVLTVHKYSDFAKATPDVDFLICNWEKFSIKEKDRRWQTIDDAIQKMNPQVFEIDECHNAKGSNSWRSKSIRRITQHSLEKYMMLLSATPIPNRYRDLSTIFHILDPKKYPDPNMFSYSPPAVIKELLARQVWFRLTRDDLKEELGLPNFSTVELPIQLSDDEAHAYFKAWADCVHLGEGFMELRKILYDARLSKYGGNIDSSFVPAKMFAVDKFVGELRDKNHKIIVKTNLVENIVNPYEKMLVKHGNVLKITGATDPTERRKKIRLFQNDAHHNILFMSRVGEESTSIVTGSTECALIPLEPEMDPREYIQFSGRVYRRGQTGQVTHYTLLTQSKLLDHLMITHLEEIARTYECKIPKNFRPRTIDIDMHEMRKAKVAITEKIYDGHKITKQEESLYNADIALNVITHFEALIAPSTFKNIAPFALSTLIQARWRNLGERQFGQLIKTKGWGKWCSLYEQGWEDSASKATLQAIGREIDAIELGPQPTIIDIGSGAAYFSRATGKSAICVDIDENFLKKGQRICDELGIQNTYVPALATNTGLPAKSADVIVNSYMLFYLGQDARRNEIEQCIIEKNRIAKRGSYVIISLPYTVEDRAITHFNHSMEQYGMTEIRRRTPQETKTPFMKNGCHILTYKKTRDVEKPLGIELSFYDKVRIVQ